MKKPKIRLNLLEEKAVETPTQESFTQLMRVYECGNWIWKDGDIPTLPGFLNEWEKYQKETCVEAGSPMGLNEKIRFGCASKDSFLATISFISDEAFYEIQGVTQEKRSEINAYFDLLEK